MRRHLLFAAAALALALAAPAAAQDRIPADERPGECPVGGPLQVWLLLQSSATDCDDTVSGTVDALCCCVNNTWAACASGGSGSVTSVALAVPAEWSVSGSPVTTSGTITISEATQTANTVYSGPTSGGAAAPGFRALVAADIPAHLILDLGDDGGNDSTALSEIATSNDHGGALTEASADKAVLDFDRIGRPYSHLLDFKTGAADTPDDDFSSGTLDGKWTVLSGAAGTVSLIETGTTIEEYDLATRPGWLLMQAGRNISQIVSLRQDYTLPDGNSIIVAFSVNTGSSGTGSLNNSLQVSLAINSDDTTLRTAPYLEIFYDSQTTDASRVYVSSNVGSDYAGPPVGAAGGVVYFRIARSSLTYAAFTSVDGATWMPVANRTLASAPTNVWIQIDTAAAITGPIAPIVGVDWIRLGSNALDPW